VVLFRYQLVPGDQTEEGAEVRNIPGTRSIQSLSPRQRGGEKSGAIKVPDWIIAKELAATTA
jgi:hypothetical protein